jgi:hypothetical protein
MPDAQVQQARALDAMARELPKITKALTALNENLVAIGKDFRKVVGEYIEEPPVDPEQLTLGERVAKMGSDAFGTLGAKDKNGD